jgi:hypothetical protein
VHGADFVGTMLLNAAYSAALQAALQTTSYANYGPHAGVGGTLTKPHRPRRRLGLRLRPPLRPPLLRGQRGTQPRRLLPHSDG